MLILSSGALAAQTNLLVNPGFEEGTHNDAPPWAVGGWRGSVRAVTTEKHSGRRSIMHRRRRARRGINSVMKHNRFDPTGCHEVHIECLGKAHRTRFGSQPRPDSRPLGLRPRRQRRSKLSRDSNDRLDPIHDSAGGGGPADGIIPPAGATMLASQGTSTPHTQGQKQRSSTTWKLWHHRAGRPPIPVSKGP